MNRRGGETLDLVADRFMSIILAPMASFAFGLPSKMWHAALC
jgi:hypothetical protein